jgi:hypothetical protein
MVTMELEEAYRRTIYRVTVGGEVIELRVGERSLKLEESLHDYGQDHWVLITAFNPRSRPISLKENQRRDKKLEAQLIESGYLMFRSKAIDPEGIWPDEWGFVAFGMKTFEGHAIAKKFDQNAILTGSSGLPVHLHFVDRACDCDGEGDPHFSSGGS